MSKVSVNFLALTHLKKNALTTYPYLSVFLCTQKDTVTKTASNESMNCESHNLRCEKKKKERKLNRRLRKSRLETAG